MPPGSWMRLLGLRPSPPLRNLGVKVMTVEQNPLAVLMVIRAMVKSFTAWITTRVPAHLGILTKGGLIGLLYGRYICVEGVGRRMVRK